MIANAGITDPKLIVVADSEFLTTSGKRYLNDANDSARWSNWKYDVFDDLRDKSVLGFQ